MLAVKRGRPRRLTREDRADEIRGFVSLCFAILTEDLALRDIAEAAGLHHSTIYRLWNGGASLRTQCGTLQAIGYAAGLKLELTETASRITMVD